MISRRSTIRGGILGAMAIVAPAARLHGAAPESAGQDVDHLIVRHRRVTVNGIELFYREAGRRDAPALLLLHGFPTSSHMFRHLIPALADRYRVVAPDYPGFGYSDFPPTDRFTYSFASYAELIAAFTDAVGLDRYALFIQDYGAPVGLRLALLRPDNVRALITQNGNAYSEGLSPLWAPLKAYWNDPSEPNRQVLEGWLGPDGTQLQYTAGVPTELIDRLAPDSWTLDWVQLSRPGNREAQIALFGDYRHNVALYPDFQRWMRHYQPPALIIWGRNDPFFTVAGATAYRRDLPRAELHLLEGSHFLLETHGPQACGLIRAFLAKTFRLAGD